MTQILMLALSLLLFSACGGGSNTPDSSLTHNGISYGVVTSPYTGKVWLDRNLGAARVCTSFNDTACYGDYYQWGRNFDGHQDSMSPHTKTQATDVNSAGSSFIASSYDLDWDWAKNADSDGSLRSSNWSATDGSSVCPVGFRVPTDEDYIAEFFYGNSPQIKNRDDAFNSFLKLPSAAERVSNYNDSVLIDDFLFEGMGVLWTSSPTSAFGAHSILFGSELLMMTDGPRSNGASVRCLRD